MQLISAAMMNQLIWNPLMNQTDSTIYSKPLRINGRLIIQCDLYWSCIQLGWIHIKIQKSLHKISMWVNKWSKLIIIWMALAIGMLPIVNIGLIHVSIHKNRVGREARHLITIVDHREREEWRWTGYYWKMKRLKIRCAGSHWELGALVLSFDPFPSIDLAELKHFVGKGWVLFNCLNILRMKLFKLAGQFLDMIIKFRIFNVSFMLTCVDMLI